MGELKDAFGYFISIWSTENAIMAGMGAMLTFSFLSGTVVKPLDRAAAFPPAIVEIDRHRNTRGFTQRVDRFDNPAFVVEPIITQSQAELSTVKEATN